MTEIEQLWHNHFPQFVENQDPGVKLLMASSNLAVFPKGRQLFAPGSVCENYLLVLTGKVNVQILSESGKEVLLYQVCSGDSCVLTTSCLLSGDCYPAEGITETEVTAFVFSAVAFSRGIELSAFFREFVFKNFSARLSKLISRMESVMFGTIDQKICRALLLSGQPILTKTHQELAYELGTAREVVSRHLKNLESYGWLKLGRSTIEIVNSDALANVCRDK